MLKRLLLSAFAAIACATLAPAQTHYLPHVWVGGHAGMTMSEMSFSPSTKQSYLSGVTAGLSFRYEEERHVGLLAELNIAQHGWKENFEEYPFDYQRQLTYIELPVMTHIFFGGRNFKGFINLGPQVGYMLSSKITANFDYNNPQSVEGFPTSNRYTDQMALDIKNRFDYGITAGLGCEMIINRRHSVSIEARYYYGLGSIYGSSKKDAFSASRNNTILITLGYQFRLK
jgi:hypothetical protein